jgi:hypothetical protein
VPFLGQFEQFFLLIQVFSHSGLASFYFFFFLQVGEGLYVRWRKAVAVAVVQTCTNLIQAANEFWQTVFTGP